MVEIANESDHSGYNSHPILRPENIHRLIEQAKARSGGRLMVSTSFMGGTAVPDAVIAASNFVLLHGNGLSPAGLTSLIRSTRARTAKPIFVNEDSTNVNNFVAAVGERVSWGYYDQAGFQSPPVNWTINTVAKRAFFDRIASYLAGSTPPVITGLTLINAATGQPQVIPGSSSAVLTNGVTINLAALPTRSLNIRADAVSAASVRFGYDGNPSFRVESAAPFALAGDTNNIYNSWTPTVGNHTVVVTPYSGTGAAGTAGAAVTVQFTVR
jgi:hypothetical protein